MYIRKWYLIPFLSALPTLCALYKLEMPLDTYEMKDVPNASCHIDFPRTDASGGCVCDIVSAPCAMLCYAMPCHAILKQFSDQ
ncbi:uncharacterized protein K460DRAFT_206006 [Cucurbitaria berberidis CBS 394.84]|uniref:Uncharacterized protein n=1 Tax=Cucurbitaria berberidis CBS 394.84 TaxID=1168544 RepID=A0A9P4G766_9PLEO|nr:uncharacterized protein K460DRAFT_206006 [Cucurbitaria berberidis CBS 394.84]KAF1840285.1 hypothetical protein K460DRAFT_206006 [Cucurbitaria berberidis CBS 394.84]